ncbi:ionotropic receptor 25a-like [Saccostrea cucullata]|uniref:ionotropic receptor 25a-like n=1 Tax=Saccostrea cuccullata TaxID=36930 RepID=UPI002ED68BC2
MSGTIASSSMFGFVDVFDGPVWLAWFGFLGLTGIMLYVFHILVYRVFSKEKEKDKDKVFTISDTLWFLISSITIYGPDKTPGTFAGRVLVIGFWFFCQIMMATYTANLAAFMTSKRLTTEIHSINELASQNSIKYSALAGSVSEAYFSRMKGIEENFFELWKNMSYAKSNDRNDLTVWDYPLDDLYSRMFSQINETGFLKTSKEGVDRVLSEGFAFIHETPMIKYEMTKYCNLITVGEVFSAKPYAFVLQENSPLKDAFNAKILELQADAYFEQRKEVWWSKSVSCPKEDDSTTGLPFKNLSGVFILTGAGFATGFLMLGIECIVFKWKKRKESREKPPKEAYSKPKYPLIPRLTSLRSLFMKSKKTTSTMDLTISEVD